MGWFNHQLLNHPASFGKSSSLGGIPTRCLSSLEMVSDQDGDVQSWISFGNLSPYTQVFWKTSMGVSKNRGTPKWMVYNGKPYKNGWFGGNIPMTKIPNKFCGWIGDPTTTFDHLELAFIIATTRSYVSKRKCCTPLYRPHHFKI